MPWRFPSCAAEKLVEPFPEVGTCVGDEEFGFGLILTVACGRLCWSHSGYPLLRAVENYLFLVFFTFSLFSSRLIFSFLVGLSQ